MKRLRFSLKLLLIFMLLVAILLGWRVILFRNERRSFIQLRDKYPELAYQIDGELVDPSIVDVLYGAHVKWISISFVDHGFTIDDWLAFKYFKDIEALTLINSDITIDEVALWPPLPQLRELDITDSYSFDDNAAKYVTQKCPHLRSINLENTSVTDRAIRYLSNLHKLESLNLTCTKVRGSNLSILSKCPLEKLVLDKNTLTRNSIKQIAEIQSLKHLSISDSVINGQQLINIGNLKLEDLYIWGIDVNESELINLEKMLPGCKIVPTNEI